MLNISMLFAHAPAGFLATYYIRKIWVKKISKSQTNLLYFLGAIFGIFPDIDTVYYYFFSAILHHREIFTHSLIFYIIIWLVLFFIGRLSKKEFLKALGFVFLFTGLSHLILDSLGNGIMWFYPFSSLTFGLLAAQSIADSFFGQFFLFINLFFETIIILWAANLLFFKFFKKYFKFVFLGSYPILLAVIFLLYISSPHLYQGQANFNYKDKDNDKIINLRDRDLDGDGILNIEDSDADGDGKNNIKQIVETAKKMENIKYDKSEGGFWEIPSRFGFLSKTDVVIIPYNVAGIFLKKELEEDFQKHSYRYVSSPKSSRFVHNSYNLFIFFRNNGMLKSGGYFKDGDIVFFGEKAENIALVIDGSKKDEIRLIAAGDDKIIFLSINQVKGRYGKLIGVGRLRYK